MNKNIKELANEAGLLTYNPEGVSTKFEKFAELIVLKCASLIEAQDVSPAFELSMNIITIGKIHHKRGFSYGSR